MIAASVTFKIDFFFFLFYKKPLRNRYLLFYCCYECMFCWVTECVAPSIDALTARVATALVM